MHMLLLLFNINHKCSFLALSTSSLNAPIECLKASCDYYIILSVLKKAWQRCSKRKHLQGTLDSTILCIISRHSSLRISLLPIVIYVNGQLSGNLLSPFSPPTNS